MTNYDIYKHARDMAWQWLIDNNVNDLPVNLGAICKTNGYNLLLDSKSVYLGSSDRGATFMRNGEWQIVLNAFDNVQVRRYTLAHEIGHIYLGHTLTEGKYGRSFGVQRTPKSPQEYQAERFAIDILAPACVLWGLKLHTADEIASVCNISMRAAELRTERMKILYQRGKFLTSQKEIAVFRQFSGFMGLTNR